MSPRAKILLREITVVANFLFMLLSVLGIYS